MKKGIWLALLALALAGCASEPGRDINDPTNSLVFGYIDMDDAPTSVANASIMRVAPADKQGYWHMTVIKGLFYNAYLPTGSYQLSQFSGSGFFSGAHVYSFPRQGNQTALRIEKPGIYFLGSYKYKNVKTGMFEGYKFSIDNINKPTEAELLRRIIDESEVKGSAWRDKIQARLAKLKR
jgi:hypothetical protein